MARARAAWARSLLRPDLTGVAFAALFFCLSLTPSLLPRDWLTGGIIGGINSAIGYGIGVVIGAAVHVHHVAPDIKWWKKAEWTKFKAQMEGTTVLRLPKGMNFFFHWIMVHVPHHVDMRVPMYHLEEAADAIEEAFPGTVIDKPFRFRDYLGNTHQCKLYDFDDGRWMTYRQARQEQLALIKA